MALDLRKATALEKRGRVHEVTFRREYLEMHQPVVVEEITALWKAHSRWSPAYLCARFGDVPLRFGAHTTTLSDLFEAVEAGEAPQLWGLPLREVAPELLEDVAPPVAYEGPDWLDHRLIPDRVSAVLDREPLIEIGGFGSASPLRLEPFGAHCFMTQVVGSQRLLMFPPEHEEYVYPRSDEPLRSQLGDLRDVDPKEYPLLDRAELLTTELEAGETAFIPSGWWHQGQPTSVASVGIATRIVNGSNFGEFLDELWDSDRSLATLASSLVLQGYGWWRGREEASRAELLAAVR